MRANGPRTILITGASGVVGRAVADELRDQRVIGLVHADTDVPEMDTAVYGDLSLPRLGLTEDRWRVLADEIDVIVHSGALTAWGQPRERYQAINVDGTQRVIELAQLAGAPVHMISTCFVYAVECAGFDRLGPTNVVKPYIWSKLEAERLLADSGVPHTVFRPTNLVGHSCTGASSRRQIVQMLSEWICRGKAPFFPAPAGGLVDVVALDVLTLAVARAIEFDDLGNIYWVASGEDAMTVEEALEILVEHARDMGREIECVPIVDPTGPLPIPLERVPATSQAFLKVLIDASEVAEACGGAFPSSLDELRERFGVPVGSDRDAYRLSLKYWAKKRVEELETTTEGAA
jgi:nucleoside-diphosphate-sugar epimerase